MATKLQLLLILSILSIWAIDGAHHAPAPTLDCSTIILTMSDCLSFVTNGSKTTKPEGSCCSGLKPVLKTAPTCLCEAFKSSSQFGVVLNVTKAVSLPSACKVSAPSVSNCALSETPAAAPANKLSPSPSPSLGNSASALFPISAGSLFVGLVLPIFSGILCVT
ncbi:hypothetical protein Lal_00038731 [Lupinus albus]|uniref:Putative plant lipid transfer protein/Par allergen n=1 Tax=Lupinus albus TaxID=3870 RepID=A0A6A5N7R4_LUPAL|nr:putative plant lipid transfer protein/Par allergen [Lupinus albus]KAF1882087.1 hypothetical protein Lal_00038731 [Lupinus albus]